MKFLYPIKKLNLKPWIKYWLLKKTSGESTLKAVTLSEGTLTKVDKSKALRIKEYYGNTVQNGTPTPETPIEVQTISGDNEIVVNGNSYRVDLGGKNKFNTDVTPNVTWHTTIVSQANGSLILKPTQAGGSGYVSFDMPCNSNITYTVSLEDIILENLGTWTGQFYIYEYNANNTEHYIGNITKTSLTKTFTTQLDTVRLRLQPYSYRGTFDTWETGQITYKNIMLCEGTDTEYSPYTANPIELCKIGNYQDKLYYDSGKWYLHKEVGKVVLNGSEDWQQNSAQTLTNTSLFYTSVIDNYVDISKTCLCNYFIRKQIWSVDEEGIYFYTGWSSLRIRIKTSLSSNVANFKTWLSTHNTTVYYVLAEPTTTEITDTNLISQLNALYEFYVNSSTVNISNSSEIPLEVLLEYYGR